MNNSKKMTEIIEKKKELSQEKTPKYGTRKLSIGLVSCMLGFSLIIAPGSSKAAEASENETVATETNTPEENPVEEATPVANEEIKKEETKEEVVAKQADTFVEKLETIEVEEGEEIDYKEAVTNLPQDAKLDVVTPVDTKEAGEKTTSAKITFADGSEKEIQIKVNVKAVEAKEEAEDLEFSEKVERQPAKAPESPKTGVRDAAPPEDTTTTPDAKNAVHGYVGVQAGGDLNLPLGGATGQQFKPIGGVKVYFQWFEKWSNGKEYTSPVYSATSGADGQFHMGIKSYVAPDGNLIRFDADTTVSAGNERYKIWVDESTIPDGYALQYMTGEGVVFLGSGLPITQGGSGSDTTKNTHVNWKVLLRQKPKNMHKEQATDSPVASKTGGNISGNVSWDYSSGVGGIHWQAVADKTSPAKDVVVKASYLSDYAMKKIFSDETAKMLNVDSPSKIRGIGWTAALEQQLQEWIQGEVAKDPDNWIAETVQAKTNAEGNYIIQFNGTWGPDRNYDAATKERKAGNTYDGWVGHKWTEEEVNRLGTIADDANSGTFATEGVNYWNRKHINDNWIYISTEGTDHLRVMTPFNNNYYTYRNNNYGINVGWNLLGKFEQRHKPNNSFVSDFALAPQELKFNVTNYDSGANTATPGDVAQTATEGLPYSGVTSDTFRIVWYDEDGNVVNPGKVQKPNGTGHIESEPFDTKGVDKTTTFTAKLYRVDSKGNNTELLAQDSFTVVVEDSKKITSMYDEFEYKNPNPLKGATYSAKGLPDGLTIDPKTGDIKGVAKESGKFQVEVITTVPDDSGDITASRFYTFTVTDSPLEDGIVGKEYDKKVEPKQIDGYVYKNVTAKFIDGKTIDGLTITGDQITGTPKAKVDATQEEPNVEVTYDIYQVNEKGEEILIKKGHIDRVPLSITEEAKDTTKPEIGDLDDDDNPDTPVAPKEDENNKGPQVWANGARVTEGQKITPIRVNVKDDTDKNPTVEVTGLPKGLSYNKETGKIEGTPEKLTNWADTEEERDFTATIKVKDAAGNEQTKEIQITILRDTDGDGKPDSTDPDDDNDGIKDEEDKNPKAWDAKVEGKVTTPKGTQPTVDQYKEKITNLPKGSKVVIKTQPDVSKADDKQSAVVTVTLPNGEKVDVKVPVTVTDTTPTEDTTKPEIGDLDDDDDPKTPVAPKEDETDKGPQVWANGARVTEGQEITPIKVNVTDDKDKNPKVEVTGLPKGLSYNKETGKIEGTPDKLTDWKDTEEERDFTATIKATDASGNKQTKEIQITVLRDTDGDGTPDSTDPDDDNDGINDDKDQNPKAWDANVNGKVETPKGTQPTVDQYKEKITNLPKGSKVVIKTQPDVSKAGDTEAVVTVTLPNGEKVDVKVPVTVTDTTPDKPAAPTLKANDDGSVTVTPPTDKDVDVVQITYTDENNHQGTLVATKDKDGNWKLPDGTDPSITIDPATGVVTIPANQVKDGSEVKAVAEKDGTHSDEAKVNAKNNPVTKKEITKWVQETADGRTIELKKQDGAHPDNDGKSDIEGYEFVRTDKTEDDTTITYTNVYKLLLGSKAVGLDGKELKEATIGYDKENPEEFKGYTYLFDEGENTPSDVQGKKAYLVNRIYAKNPAVVEVANPDSLTADEQNKVKEAVKTANPDLLDNQISVNEKGEVTITRGKQTATLDPSLTVVKQGQTPAPTITQPKAGDTTVSGTAEPGATVKVTLPDGTEKETKADDKGNWSVDTPALEKDQTVKAVAQEDGKDQSDEATKTVAEADPTEATAKPEITAPKAGDTEIKGKAEPNAKVEVELPDGTKVETKADGEGNWTVKVPEGKEPKENDVVKAVATVDGKNPSEEATATTGKADEDGNKTIADKTDPNIPSKTEVKDKNNLTDEEKDKVKKAIEDANKDKFPQGTKVEIGKDGTATITYPDGSVDIIKGNDLVIQKAKAGASGSINRVNSSNTGKNVKTGVGSSATILATLAAAVSGLFASKKRKND